MCDSRENWKRGHVYDVSASIDFFASSNKFDREKWVVCELLTACAIPFRENELLPASEPGDVTFRNATFQVKEIMEPHRRRGDEYKAHLEKVLKASTEADLLEQCVWGAISFSEVAGMVLEKTEKLSLEKYGPTERGKIDLLFYFNFVDVTITPPTDHLFEFDGFRSVSLVSNTYCAVLYTAETAPDFLKKCVIEKQTSAAPNVV